MVTLDAGQLAIVNGTVKAASWLFDVTDRNLDSYRWSTKNVTTSAGASANLNTRSERASSVSMLLSFVLAPPLPDNDLDAQDRAHVVNNYAARPPLTGTSYTFKVVNFDGITLSRPRTESGIMPPSELRFSIVNKDNVYDADDFEGGYVTLSLAMGNGTDAEVSIRAWKFLIRKVEGSYQQLDFTCDDFFQQYIEGDYPGAQYVGTSTAPAWDAGEAWDTGIAWDTGTSSVAGRTFGIKVRDIFPSAEGDIEDDCCLPLPFGVCYVPIRSAYISTDRFYVLGPTVIAGASITYTITAVRSPRDYSVKTEYESGSYTFTQDTKVNADGYSFKVFQAIIAGGPPPDSNGLFANGDHYYDMPTEFSRSDTATITNPADVIQYVLEDMGVATADIGATTFAAAEAVYDGWGLAFAGAFWKVMPREKALALLLAMCHSTLVISDKVELHVLDSTSRKTITAADILRGGDAGLGTYRYSVFTRTLATCGNVLYSPTGDAQDIGVNALVAAKTDKTHIDSEPFQMPFVADATIAANIAKLYFQRKLMKKSEERLTVKATSIALDPGDFITISGGNYGGTHDVIVDSMSIRKDCSIDMICTGFTDAIDNYA